MRIICPAAAAHLHPHVVLVDAPGVQDANAARGNVVKKLLEELPVEPWGSGVDRFQHRADACHLFAGGHFPMASCLVAGQHSKIPIVHSKVIADIARDVPLDKFQSSLIGYV